MESLETLKELIDRVDWIVPGHGNPANPSEAKKRLEMDQRYLEALHAMRIKDFSDGFEAQAQAFLQWIGETRAEEDASWQIHLANLRAAYRWLN